MKARLSLGTTIKIRDTYYKVTAELEDEFLCDSKHVAERKAVAIAEFDDLEDTLQTVLTDKLNNFVVLLDGKKWDKPVAKSSSPQRRGV